MEEAPRQEVGAGGELESRLPSPVARVLSTSLATSTENSSPPTTSFDPSMPPPGTLFQNFESSNSFAGLGWTTTGDFVGQGPAKADRRRSGFLGNQLVNTFLSVVANGTLRAERNGYFANF